MQREADLASPAGRISSRAILDGWGERTQGVSIHLGPHKAFVAGERTTADISGDDHMLGTRLRDSSQLRVEPHSSRRASQMQRDRLCDPVGYIDIRQDVIMQELRNVEQRQTSRRHRLQSLCTRAGIDKNGPSAIFTSFNQGTYGLLGLAVALTEKSLRIERLAAAQVDLPSRRDDLEACLVQETIQRGGDGFAGMIVARGPEHLTGATREIDNVGLFHVPIWLPWPVFCASAGNAATREKGPAAAGGGSYHGPDGVQASFARDCIERRRHL